MSIAIIYNDGVTDTFGATTWVRRQISTLAVNQGSIVQNFRTAEDTFQLASGIYRFDALVAVGMSFFLTARVNSVAAQQTALMNEYANASIAPGIANYTRRDESQFTAGGYLIGTASAVSAVNDTFTFNNHQLSSFSTVFFTGSVPGGITANTLYGVSFAGISAANQPNQFKALDLSTSAVVNLTTTTTPEIYAELRAAGGDGIIDMRHSVARYEITIPVGFIYTFSVRNGGSGKTVGHSVSTALGASTVPSRYLSLRITKTD